MRLPAAAGPQRFDDAGSADPSTAGAAVRRTHSVPLLIGTPTVRAELERFDAHLDEVCGLAASTRLTRCGWIREFLCKEFGSARIRIAALTPRAIEAFVTSPADRHAPGTAHAIGSALRSYLRFRASIGDQTATLVAAVPSIAHWCLCALPPYLSKNEVDRLLHAFDRRTPSGQRGYAMIRCLLNLGLRASEVAHIRLDDLDWASGTLRIAGAKGRRIDLLPLPDRTGRALVAYLQGHRPRRPSPWLFVRHRAPLDVPVGPEIVRCTVRMAFARCGLDRYTGTHVLRHTAATRFLHAGASLKDIADVLRHRCLDTTTIYTKVDLPKLAAVATPWPGTPS